MRRSWIGIAREQQSYTVLYADAPGAEQGEVVRAGQTIPGAFS